MSGCSRVSRHGSIAWGARCPPSNRTQAEVPEGAVILPNARGTRRGSGSRTRAGAWSCCSPACRGRCAAPRRGGAPRIVARQGGERRVVLSRTVRTTGVSESARRASRADRARHRTAHTRVPASVKASTSGSPRGARAQGRRSAACRRRATPQAAVGEHGYGEEDADLAAVLLEALRTGRHRLAVAESCTGGMIGERIPPFRRFGHLHRGRRGVRDVIRPRRSKCRSRPRATARSPKNRAGDGRRRAAPLLSGLYDRRPGIAGPGGGTPRARRDGVAGGAGPHGHACAAAVLPGDRDEVRRRAAQQAWTCCAGCSRRPDAHAHAPDGTLLVSTCTRLPRHGPRCSCCTLGRPCRSLARPRRAVVRRGYSSYLLELRGHGVGGAGAICRASASCWATSRRSAASCASGRPPPAAARTSFGGLVALRYLETQPSDPSSAPWSSRVARLAFARPPGSGGRPAVCRTLAHAPGAGPARCRHGESRPGGERGVRGRSGRTRRDDARRVARDPVAQRAVPADSHRIESPVLFLLAGEDRVVDAHLARAFADSLKGSVLVAGIRDVPRGAARPAARLRVGRRAGLRRRAAVNDARSTGRGNALSSCRIASTCREARQIVERVPPRRHQIACARCPQVVRSSRARLKLRTRGESEILLQRELALERSTAASRLDQRPDSEPRARPAVRCCGLSFSVFRFMSNRCAVQNAPFWLTRVVLSWKFRSTRR